MDRGECCNGRMSMCYQRGTVRRMNEVSRRVCMYVCMCGQKDKNTNNKKKN